MAFEQPSSTPADIARGGTMNVEMGVIGGGQELKTVGVQAVIRWDFVEERKASSFCWHEVLNNF